MSALGVRRLLVRRRHRLTVIAAVVAIAAAVAYHHGAIAMSEMHDGHATSTTIALCLGILAVVSALAGVVACLPAPTRWRAPIAIAPTARGPFGRARFPRVRAGPALLCVLCISRR